MDILVSAKIWPRELAFSAHWNFDEVMFHQHVCITLYVHVCEMSKSSKIHRAKLRNKYVTLWLIILYKVAIFFTDKEFFFHVHILKPELPSNKNLQWAF